MSKESDETVAKCEELVLNSLVEKCMKAQPILDGYAGRELKDSKAVRGAVKAYNWRISMINPNAEPIFYYEIDETPKGIKVRRGR